MTLDVYKGELVARARTWVDLPLDERRRRAVAAARDRDTGTLWDLTEAYMTTHGSAGARVRPHTLRMYRLGVRHWLAYGNTAAVALLNPAPDAGALYLRSLEASGKAPSTAQVYLAGVRQLYRALRWAGATTADPFLDARPARDKTAPWDKRHPYPEEDVQKLLAAATPELRLLVLLGAHAGLRTSEMVALRWEDVHLDAGTLRVRDGKGGKTRVINLSASLTQALAALQAVTGPVVGRSPEAARLRLKTLCKQVGVAYRGLHALRHYNGTRIVRAGLSLEAAAQHLGHASIETTRVYAKWSDDTLKRELGRW